MNQAFMQLKEGAFDDALDNFNHYLLQDSSDPRAYLGRGMVNFQLKKWPDAESDFRTAQQMDPEELESWVGLGMSLAMQNKIYEAVKVLESLLVAHPNFVRGRIQLGNLYYHLGTIKKGHEQMDLALQSRPTLEERRTIEQLQKQQQLLDKKRFYRPDFEALRKQNESEGRNSWFAKAGQFLKRKFKLGS